MIIVTGATGQLGRDVVMQLLRRIPAAGIGLSVRDPSRAADFAALGLRVRRGDFAAPASLHAAFEGASQVLLISSNARSSGGDALAQHRAALDAAAGAGARRLVYTSHLAASAASAFPPMRDHAATEAMLAASGLAWTALRHGFYAASGVMLLGDAAQTGRIAAPADGKVSWTAHADLAEAAAIVLTREGLFDGPTPPLTGPEALDLADLAERAGKVLGRAVQRVVIPEAELRQRMAARGVPEPGIEAALGLFAASRAGEFAATGPALAQLLGRAPTAMLQVLGAALTGGTAG